MGCFGYSCAVKENEFFGVSCYCAFVIRAIFGKWPECTGIRVMNRCGCEMWMTRIGMRSSVWVRALTGNKMRYLGILAE